MSHSYMYTLLQQLPFAVAAAAATIDATSSAIAFSIVDASDVAVNSAAIADVAAAAGDIGFGRCCSQNHRLY